MLKKSSLKRISRFLISGGTAAITEFITFLILNKFITFIIIANSLSFLFGLIISYNLNKSWVFNTRGSFKRFSQYLILAIINLFLSNIFLIFLTKSISIPELISKIITMILIATSNYIIFSRIIFKKEIKV